MVGTVDDDVFVKLVGMVKDRLVRLSDINELTHFVFELPDYDSAILIWKKSDKETTSHMLSELTNFFEHCDTFDAHALETDLISWIEYKRYKNGDVLHIYNVFSHTSLISF